MSCQGGPLTAGLLFQGGDFSALLPMLGPQLGLQGHTGKCALPLGALGPCWPRDDYPCGLLVAKDSI